MLDVATSFFAGAHDVEGIHVTFIQGQRQINIVDHGQNVVGHSHNMVNHVFDTS